MPRSRTVWKDGQLFAEYVDGELTYLNPSYRAPNRSEAVQAPMYMRDIGEYISPLDGQAISSRSAHRDHMKAHDVIEVGNERMPSAPSAPKVDHDIGHAIKRRIEEVASLPQSTYDTHVVTQRAEHEAISALATATP